MGFEILIVGVAGTVLVLYHVHLWREIRSTPELTALGHARVSRHRWIQSVMRERRDILAVQTLRNWIMAASFLASTGVLLTIGLLSFLLSTNTVPAVLHQLNFLGSTDPVTLTLKYLLLALCFFMAFFSFSLSIRYFNQVALDISLPVRPEDDTDTRVVTALFDRGANHYTLGMRAYYLSIPLTLWFFGPIWMLASVIVLVLLLHRFDHIRPADLKDVANGDPT